MGDDDPTKVYGAAWCGDCRRAERFLADQRISYEWHDIEREPELIDIVRERNGGKNIIPTIVFPDGSHLAEPTDEELADKLGLEQQLEEAAHEGGRRWRWIRRISSS